MCGLGSVRKNLSRFTKDVDKHANNLYKIKWGEIGCCKQARSLSGKRKKLKKRGTKCIIACKIVHRKFWNFDNIKSSTLNLRKAIILPE